jgi:hypothetical protein
MERRQSESSNNQIFVISYSYLYVKHMTVHYTYTTILNNIIQMTILYQAMLSLLQNCDTMHN